MSPRPARAASDAPPAPAVPLAEGEPPRLSALLRRLEQIRGELDRDDLDIEEQMELYREGCQLAARARKILDTAAAEIEILTGDSEGAT